MLSLDNTNAIPLPDALWAFCPPGIARRGRGFFTGDTWMSKAPAFQFYASDWLGSTRRAMMTPAQRGAYIDLLCYQWGDATCSLPDDDETLATLSGLGDEWVNGSSSTLRPCFPKHPTLPGRIANPRLLEVKAARDEWVERSRQGGIKSGKARQKPTKGTSRPPEGHLNTPSPSSSPSSSLPSPSAPQKNPLDEIKYPDGLDTPQVREIIEQWLAYRRRIQKPYKDIPQQIGLLLKKYGNSAAFAAAVDNSIAQGLQGCYPPDRQYGKSAADPRGTQAAMDKFMEGKHE